MGKPDPTVLEQFGKPEVVGNSTCEPLAPPQPPNPLYQRTVTPKRESNKPSLFERVKHLTVELQQEQIVLRGLANSYYVKQLAQQAVLDLFPDIWLQNAIAVSNRLATSSQPQIDSLR